MWCDMDGVVLCVVCVAIKILNGNHSSTKYYFTNKMLIHNVVIRDIS